MLTNTAFETKLVILSKVGVYCLPALQSLSPLWFTWTVLTWEQGPGVLLPVPVSHHSGPKVCLDMPFPAPLSPETPSTRLQKNHSSFKSCTSRDPWKDAAISFVLVSVNMDWISENARFLPRIKSIFQTWQNCSSGVETSSVSSEVFLWSHNQVLFIIPFIY